jgi:hypothetical protein
VTERRSRDSYRGSVMSSDALDLDRQEPTRIPEAAMRPCAHLGCGYPPELNPRLKILDVLLDIEYKPSIEGWSWCASRLRSLYSLRFPMLPRAT